MSKKFAKILTICLLVIIIPVAIVTTAIVLSSSVKYTVSLEKLGFETGAGSVELKINGRAVESLEVSRNSKVTITVNATGYDVNGLYLGAATDVDTATDTAVVVNEDSSLTYTIEKIKADVTYTADCTIWDYSISYDGIVAAERVKYGSVLEEGTGAEDATSPTGYKVFDGWKINGEGDVYTNATFPKTATTVALETTRKDGYEELIFDFIGKDLENHNVIFEGGTDFRTSTRMTSEDLGDLEESFVEGVLQFGRDLTIQQNKELTGVTLTKANGLTIYYGITILGSTSIQDIINDYNVEGFEVLQSGATIQFELTYRS